MGNSTNKEMRFLIIDDHDEYAKMLGMYFKSLGEVDYAVNATEGFKQFCKAAKDGSPYFLICVDVMMPRCTGIEAIQWIRDMEKNLGLESKIVLMTGKQSLSHIDEVDKYNVLEFVKKSDGLEPFLLIMEKLQSEETSPEVQEDPAP